MSSVSDPILPISRSALDRLGRRLAQTSSGSGPTADDDLTALASVLEAYDEVLVRTKARVDEIVDEARRTLGVALETPTSRLKTTPTLVDKLRRQPNLGLKDIQDIAGIRVVGAINRSDQDRICEMISDGFSQEPKPSRLTDRRENPSFGYRAVHVVVYSFGLPVEVQVRTLGQQLWANFYERLGDVFGRGIRYGEEPVDADQAFLPGMTRRDFVRALHSWSEQLDMLERTEVELVSAERAVKEVEERLGITGQDAFRELDLGPFDQTRQLLAQTRARHDEVAATIIGGLHRLNQLIAGSRIQVGGEEGAG
jgi:ppGpp synthetase/RelA/SpoT-type nucleotidyltranferase